jgi:hypothetical protein
MNSDSHRHWLIEGWTAQPLDSQMLSSVARHLADTTGKCIYLARKGTWVLTTPEGIRSRKPLKIEIVAAGDKVEGVFPETSLLWKLKIPLVSSWEPAFTS